MDKTGQTVDVLLTAHRDRKAAKRFLPKAIRSHRVPEKMTIDKSGANTAAIYSYNAEQATDIELGQAKYLNNIVEQDHRAVKPHWEDVRVQSVPLHSHHPGRYRADIHDQDKKGQLHASLPCQTAAQQFYSLAA